MRFLHFLINLFSFYNCAVVGFYVQFLVALPSNGFIKCVSCHEFVKIYQRRNCGTQLYILKIDQIHIISYDVYS